MRFPRFLPGLLATLLLPLWLTACATSSLRGTGDLGVVIERANGQVSACGHLDPHGTRAALPAWGICRMPRWSFRAMPVTPTFSAGMVVSARSTCSMQRIVQRVMQSGNGIGGSISQDGRLVVAQNYDTGRHQGVRCPDTWNCSPKYPPNYFTRALLQGRRAGRCAR